MSEAFVKTLNCGSAPDRLDDFNENQPYSRLTMRSPREFRRAHKLAEVSR